jgi:transposase
MALGKPRDARKEQQWRDRIQHWQQSGLSVRAFCERHGLATPSFYAWRRTLAQRNAVVPAFVAVQLTPDDDADAPAAATGGLEVVLASGRRLRVAPGFDSATLRQLLAVLEEAASC